MSSLRICEISSAGATAPAPAVSVLMCVANGAKYLREAIDSILGQSFGDFEFIIVENGSTDDTLDMLMSYEDPRIRVFRTPVRQLPFNLNLGLAVSRAALVARMDADDVALPDRLARQVERFDSEPDLSVVGTNFVRFGDGVAERTSSLPETDRAIRRWMPFRMVLAHPTVMLKRELVLEARGYEHTRLCEDLDLWLRLARSKGVKFANIREPLLRYRVHAGQSMGRAEAYYSAASILLKEAMLQKRIDLAAAVPIYLGKGLLLGRK